MWQLYQKCKTLGQRPSDELDVTNNWAAYQFNSAVVWLGIAIENALQERDNIGTDDKPEWRERYTLEQILEPGFRLPLDAAEELELPPAVLGIVTDEVKT